MIYVNGKKIEFTSFPDGTHRFGTIRNQTRHASTDFRFPGNMMAITSVSCYGTW